MAQHMVLIGVAAPLFALGAPAPRRRMRPGPSLVVAVLVQTTVLLAWHAPAAFDAAERWPVLHAVEHLSLLATAAALWWVAIRAGGPTGWGPGALAVFVASFPMTALGLGMMLAQTPWYARHPEVDDQQLAGVVMWSGGGALALVGFLALGLAWVNRAGGALLSVQTEPLELMAQTPGEESRNGGQTERRDLQHGGDPVDRGIDPFGQEVL